MGQIINQFPGGGENVKAEVETYTELVDEFEGLLTDFVGLPEGADATAEDILLNKKAYVGQELVVGTFDKEAFAEAQKNVQYVWKKYETVDKQQFIAYVVSDDPDTYPDAGTQDGYYYEKMDFSIEQIIGITKMAKDTFTFASDTYLNDATLTHSLGAIPKLVIVKDEKSQVVASGRYTYIAEIFGYANNALYKNGGGNYETQSFSNYYDVTASNIRFNIASSTRSYCAGVEYTMYTFV